MTLVFSSSPSGTTAHPSRLVALWHRIVGEPQGPSTMDEQLLLELERLAEVSPHLLVDLDFVQDTSGVFDPQIWRRGEVVVRIDADGTATASVEP